MKITPLQIWNIGQAFAVLVGLFVAFEESSVRGLAVAAILSVLVDIRNELIKLNESEK